MISLFLIGSLNIMIGLLMGLTPYISRKDIPFGVSIQATDETKNYINRQKKSYFLLNVGLSVALNSGIFLISLLKSTVSEDRLVYLSLFSLFVLLGVSLISYISKHQQLKNYKKTLPVNHVANKKVLVDLSFRNEKLIFPTSYLVAINLAFVLIAVIVTVLNYQQMPEMIVTQWDFQMNPSNVTTKSWGSVMMLPMMQVFITVVMAISNHSYLSAKQEIDQNQPEVSAAKSKKFRKQSSLLNFVISVLTQLLFLSIQFSMIFESISPQVVMVLSIVFTVLVIGLVLWFSLRYGQSGDRLKEGDVTDEATHIQKVASSSDDNWKLGMFYFNPKDPSFWVEKRMGIGMTFNFAKWQGWVFLIGVTILPLVLVYVMM